MADQDTETVELHEWYIEVMLGTISATVFAATRDEAMALADHKLDDELYGAFANGTWYVSDEGAVDMDDAELAGAPQTDAKGDDAPRQA